LATLRCAFDMLLAGLRLSVVDLSLGRVVMKFLELELSYSVIWSFYECLRISLSFWHSISRLRLESCFTTPSICFFYEIS